MADIGAAIGRFTVLADMATSLRLRRVNRIRTIRGSLAIEGNTLSEEQITAIIDGRRVIAPSREIQEVRNAITAYDRIAQWNPLFANIPVESMINEHQAAYYQALQDSTSRTDSAPFIEFRLRMILDAVTISTPQVTPQVNRLLVQIRGEMSSEALQNALELQDRKSFRERYLRPAMTDGWIEMTIPDKPNSRLQKYRLTNKGRQWLHRHEG